MTIQFRPHHFLCTLCFQGKGYSRPFIRNYQKIVNSLTAETGDETLIQVTEHTDSICAPCPHRRDHLCAEQEKVSSLDKAHSSEHGITPGQTISWGAAKKQIQKNLSLNQFHEICKTCEWKKYGMCENTLREFLK